MVPHFHFLYGRPQLPKVVSGSTGKEGRETISPKRIWLLFKYYELQNALIMAKIQTYRQIQKSKLQKSKLLYSKNKRLSAKRWRKNLKQYQLYLDKIKQYQELLDTNDRHERQKKDKEKHGVLLSDSCSSLSM